MIVANDNAKANFNEASERLGSDISTTRVVAEIFSKYFFAPVRGCEARRDRYLRNEQSS